MLRELLLLGGIGILLMFILLAVIIFLVIAWIWMIVDCLTRNFKQGSERIAWLLVLIFLNIIGLILYYFIVFRKGKSSSNNRRKRRK